MTFTDEQAVLATAGVEFGPGLTGDEFSRVERQFNFRFPPDLREFLAIGLPVSHGWVNWRGDDETSIRERLNWPLDGLCFDIEHNVFWLDGWGDRPESLADSFDIARRAVSQAPVLIPICGHRYIPATPSETGNPIFSVHQADIIYYGANLRDFFENEFMYFFKRKQYTISGKPRRIEFWSRLAEENGEPPAS